MIRSVFSLVAAIVLAGCVSSPPSPKPSKQVQRTPDAPKKATAAVAPEDVISPTDPCADRLHTLCGPLLYYYALHRKLPDKLDDLRGIGGPDPDVEFACPVSGQPYVFNHDGLSRKGKPGVLVLYDAAPTHSGRRWGIAVEPPKTTGQAIIPGVVLEDELLFQTAPSETAK